MNTLQMRYRLRRFVLLCFAVLFVAISFSGCQSSDASDGTLDYSAIERSRFEYDGSTNTTKVIWSATLANNSIYDFKQISVKFNLYRNSELIKTETYQYELKLKHGDDYTGNFHFIESGKVDKIEFVSWSAEHTTFGETYHLWVLFSIIAVIVGTLAYGIYIFAFDGDFSDIWNVLGVPIVIVLFGGGLSTVLGWMSSHWVNVVIVLCAFFVFVILALILHLIKFLIFGAYDIIVDNFDDFITSISDLFQKAKQRRRKMGASHDASDDSDGDADEEEFFDNSVENIDDYLDDFEKLNCFTKEQLKNYCREHGIAGYSSLNKEALIHLIMDYQTDKAKEEKTAHQNKVNSEKNNNGINKIYFSDIAGLEEAKDAFREKVILPFEHKELFEKYGKKAGGGILLYGLPGTGKTMFAEACSNELNALFIPIKCSDIKSKWYGESEENVKKIFEKARKAKRSIIFFDEFEAIGAKRTDNDDNGNNDLVPQILAEMQGIGSSNNESTIMVIAATNKPWAIDSAFLRPGRFDEKIYIPLPDIHARKKLFELKLKNVPAENLDFEYLASMTDGFNGADITEFCEKLKISAIKATISSGCEHLITMDDVYNVKDKIKSSVSQEDIADMLDFEKMS